MPVPNFSQYGELFLKKITLLWLVSGSFWVVSDGFSWLVLGRSSF